ncbi:hypothetical protein HB364_24305 [Pseudoflavitalea sp. X16]|uniref:DUF6580 family putative transport protein n=1 Tax=Paraflavitalea devenefica TaxID=2716334 RepID=UPI0014214AB8|nr:DUF6580 family putative transport protein [Paraflavitalea devenefica]NII28228.1 hypothetical protein [Paraflavitalea devenefica]
MKLNRSTVIYCIVLIAAASVYRAFDNRMLGFAPQIAMALFGGLAIRNKAWAFALPLFSLFISDVIYEILYTKGLTPIRGFYDGQLVNYLIMASVTLVGIALQKVNIKNIVLGSLIAPTYFFIVSNLMVWLGVGVDLYPLTWDGLVACFTGALPFFKGSVIGTFFFSAIFFGVYYFVNRSRPVKHKAPATAAFAD